MLYVFLLTESLSAWRLAAGGEERPRLFENLFDHNPTRELETEADFLIFIARNPLKRLDSEK
jgi:hypothetical protein